MCRGDGLKWYNSLPYVLLGIRVSIRTDTKASAAQSTSGITLRLPDELFSSQEDEEPDLQRFTVLTEF